MSNVYKLPDSYSKRITVLNKGLQILDANTLKGFGNTVVTVANDGYKITVDTTDNELAYVNLPLEHIKGKRLCVNISKIIGNVTTENKKDNIIYVIASGGSGGSVHMEHIHSDNLKAEIQVPIDATQVQLCIKPNFRNVEVETATAIVYGLMLTVDDYAEFEPYTNFQPVYEYSNNYKLLNINEQAIADVKIDAQAVFEALDVQNATGRTLDLYGEMVGQKRGALNDAQYRIMILTRMGINVTQGNYETVINNAKQIFKCEGNEIILRDSEKPCTVEVVKFPLEVLINAGFTSTQAIEMLDTLLPIGVSINGANFDGTFEFADAADVYDEAAGFGNVNQTIGGYLGLMFGDDAESPVLPL